MARLFRLLLAWPTLATSLSVYNKAHISEDSRSPDIYDYVVVGGGLTGLVVANRLSENPKRSVVVVENGYIDRSYAVELPYATLGLNTADMWNITSVSDKQLNNATFRVPVGSVVGGGSAVNGMACTRGSRADYDAWEQLGNPGWGWDGLFPYFLKSTNLTTPLPEFVEDFGVTWNDSVWGHNGPVQVGFASVIYPDVKAVRRSWIAQGVPNVTDGASGDPLGLFWLPTSLDSSSGTRSSARAAYYDPISARPNLRLLTGHRVFKILFKNDGLDTTGVLAISRADNSTVRLSANKEVILAAGAVFTPHLLQQSGIGPKDVLEAANVTVKADLPAVGSNFQDHPVAAMAYNISNQSFPNPSSMVLNATFNATSWDEYLQNHTGPYTGGRVTGTGNSLALHPLSRLAANYEAVATNITLQNALDFLPEIYSRNASLLRGFEAQRDILRNIILSNSSSCCETHPALGGGAAMSLQKPLSRGIISLDPANPDGLPLVRYNTLMNPVDAEVLIAMVRYAREHWARPEVAQFSPVENLPGAQYQTDEEILDGLIATGILTPTNAHSSGSCAMMPAELGGCVGPDLLVYGTQKLSIVDASILPLIPGTHLQMTMYAVAEKAADIIKSRA
ncbi:hypothetical protein JX266_001260 [Neoarthrinium moseri]|nr:hypothetical protein JX266_001260 [Neoarthrinium moseri]